MSDDKRIAAFFLTVEEDLEAAELLIARGNRLAAFHLRKRERSSAKHLSCPSGRARAIVEEFCHRSAAAETEFRWSVARVTLDELRCPISEFHRPRSDWGRNTQSLPSALGPPEIVLSELGRRSFAQRAAGGGPSISKQPSF